MNEPIRMYVLLRWNGEGYPSLEILGAFTRFSRAKEEAAEAEGGEIEWPDDREGDAWRGEPVDPASPWETYLIACTTVTKG